MGSTHEVDHDALTAALQALGVVASAAECHGIATGMLAADPAARPGPWLAHLLGDEFTASAAEEEQVARLHALWRGLAQALDDTETMAFRPLLPAAGLAERAQALVDWVEGFLFGATLAGVARGEAEEFLHDLESIARLDVAAVSDGEADERALDELIEYARVGALLTREQAFERRRREGSDHGTT